ncbi:stage II sporulation protein D [Alkalihalophilus marmarensis]|uniref:stage II sporulation protein D n=1 Tax=Alkalihalophilus marmarensis TaxID=521377 RepID=UPI002DB7EE8C|nr:stage II sporulation protein D [Alkalihalophilus marmarensis]MEC2073473.1 stage II sporulation protein D [Alkalihalophilus marmarensis]
MKRLLIIATILCTVVLIIPTMMVLIGDRSTQTTTLEPTNQKPAVSNQVTYEPQADVSIQVFRSSTEQVEEVPLEEYVVGVVASEMPATFEMEALKAQALTARTYILRQMLEPGDVELPGDAIVTDTVMHQVYQGKEELKSRWGGDFEQNYARIKEAVLQTQGQVLTYDGEPITAAFFSTSNGFTENSEDYWPNPIPYLRSVESPWDERSPEFTSEKVFTKAEVEQKLGVSLPSDGTVGSITARTDGGRVATVSVGGKEFSGREIRDKLELNSSDFDWQRQGDQVVIKTRGWGHGVGMSQYGADGMAKEGKNYEEIVHHYYQGVSIQSMESYEAKLTARAE